MWLYSLNNLTHLQQRILALFQGWKSIKEQVEEIKETKEK